MALDISLDLLAIVAHDALGASVNTASELIRAAQVELAPLTANRCFDALFGLGEALQELLEQLRG